MNKSIPYIYIKNSNIYSHSIRKNNLEKAYYLDIMFLLFRSFSHIGYYRIKIINNSKYNIKYD